MSDFDATSPSEFANVHDRRRVRAEAASWASRVSCPRTLDQKAVVALHRQLADPGRLLQLVQVTDEDIPTLWIRTAEADYLGWRSGSALRRFHQAAHVVLKAQLRSDAPEEHDQIAQSFATQLVARMIREDRSCGWLDCARAHLSLGRLCWALSATAHRRVYRACAASDCLHVADASFRLAERIVEINAQLHELRPFFDRDIADSTFKICRMTGLCDDEAFTYAEATVVTAAVHRRRRGARPVPAARRIELSPGPDGLGGVQEELSRLLTLARAFHTVGRYVRHSR